MSEREQAERERAREREKGIEIIRYKERRRLIKQSLLNVNKEILITKKMHNQ